MRELRVCDHLVVLFCAAFGDARQAKLFREYGQEADGVRVRGFVLRNDEACSAEKVCVAAHKTVCFLSGHGMRAYHSARRVQKGDGNLPMR